MGLFVSCACGEVLIKSVNDTTKVRSKVLVFKDGHAFIVCKSCGAEVSAPISLDMPLLMKSKNPPLYIKPVR